MLPETQTKNSDSSHGVKLFKLVLKLTTMHWRKHQLSFQEQETLWAAPSAASAVIVTNKGKKRKKKKTNEAIKAERDKQGAKKWFYSVGIWKWDVRT